MRLEVVPQGLGLPRASRWPVTGQLRMEKGVSARVSPRKPLVKPATKGIERLQEQTAISTHRGLGILSDPARTLVLYS